MSPIADCGFPPVTFDATATPPGIIFGKDLLIRKGPTVPVEIGFNPGLIHPDPAMVQAAVAAVHAAPPASQLLDALIDTGAGESCIDEDLATQLQLPLVDQIQTAGVHGQSKLNVYLGYIRVPSLGFVEYGRFTGARLSAGGQPHRALLGRTMLQQMILVYDGRDGSVRLSV